MPPLWKACPPGTGKWRLRHDGLHCGNTRCCNYAGDQRRRALRTGKPDDFDFSRLLLHTDDVDVNGHRIVRCRYRPDLWAMADTHTLMQANRISLADMLFLFGFAHTLYWPWPCTMFITLVLKHMQLHNIKSWCKAAPVKAQGALQRIGEEVHAWMAQVTCHNGERILVRNAKRKHPDSNFPNPTKNPMTRRSSEQEWALLLADVSCGVWQKAAEQLAKEVAPVVNAKRPSPISYCRLYTLMGSFKLRLFTATWTGTRTHYLTVHYLRSVMFAFGVRSDQSEQDWTIFRSMGQGARNGCAEWGLENFSAADAARLAISRKLQDECTLEDLACFICMASTKHRPEGMVRGAGNGSPSSGRQLGRCGSGRYRRWG